MLDAEVIIVGGSVAGSAVATHLARRGHEVLVIDRAAFPREKVCGEGLMPHGVAALGRLGLDAHALGVPFVGIRYHAGGARAEGRFPGDPGVGLRRHELDQALAQLSREAGVHRVDGVVRDVGGEPGAMRVVTRGGVLRCRAVVGADGLHSKVRKRLGLQAPPRGRKRYGLRAHVRLASGRALPRTVDVHVVRGAELYLTPTGPDQVNVAVLAEAATMSALRGARSEGDRLGDALFALARTAPEVAELLDGAQPITEAAATGPLRQASRDVVADGALLVGDAAGFLDGITGEGMSLTLREAELAAEVLADGLRRGRLHARDLAPYRRRRRAASLAQVALTRAVLWGIRYRPLARGVVGYLAKRPDRFGQLLALSIGAPLRSASEAPCS
jgi:flavin-dependent dehydrogenase